LPPWATAGLARPSPSGQLAPRRPAPDHDPLPRARRARQIGPCDFPADDGILDTGDAATGVDAVDAALVVTKAGTDIVEVSLARLVGQVRVGDQRAHEDPQLGLS